MPKLFRIRMERQVVVSVLFDDTSTLFEYGDIDWKSFFTSIPGCVDAKPVFAESDAADLIIAIAVPSRTDRHARNEAELLVRHRLNLRRFGPYRITKVEVTGFRAMEKADTAKPARCDSTSPASQPKQRELLQWADVVPDLRDVLTAFIDALNDEYVDLFGDWDVFNARRNCGRLIVDVQRDETGADWVRLMTVNKSCPPVYIEAKNVPTTFASIFRDMAAQAGAETRPRPTDH